MVFLDLQFKARLEGIAKIAPTPNKNWYIGIQCVQCGTNFDKEVYFTLEDRHEMPNTRGTFNFAMKCKFCERVITVNYIERSVREYEVNEEFQTLASFDIRGGEITEWFPRDGFILESVEGTIFDEVDLGEGDWCEYDERVGDVVGVYDVEGRVSRNQ